MSDEISDVDIVKDFLKCSPERAQEMIDKGINIEFIRNRGSGLFDKAIKEAQANFLNNIQDIKDNIKNEF